MWRKIMKDEGITRRLDQVGRYTIPSELRKRMQLEKGCSIEFWVDDDCIVLKKIKEDIHLSK